MRKSRGQSLIDFAVLGLFALAIILFGIYKFGDGLANLFARNNVENKFNNSRTVRLENPQDLVSNVTVKFDGITIQPPIEKIIKNSTYIQTSGSAGRMAEMTEIMQEYITQITNLATEPSAAAFKTALNDYGTSLSTYQAAYDPAAPKSLDDKLNFLEMALSISSGGSVSTVSSELDSYLGSIAGTKKHDIIQTLTNDLLGLSKSVEYFIDPYLYVEYLEQEKKNTVAQDQELVDKIQSEALTPEVEQEIAGLIKVFYSGGYSQGSPTTYNGRKMCDTFSGTIDPATNVCTIPTS
ncbi:MAG: hypothetical protein A2Y25_09485 [Candidatus Melainabacteria bacterium GWF2_37_15]|nr:MAG: hypothetical protein A2Y25_09485 [Candidatus Melainabacteria bacterium GWF2_37_15]